MADDTTTTTVDDATGTAGTSAADAAVAESKQITDATQTPEQKAAAEKAATEQAAADKATAEKAATEKAAAEKLTALHTLPADGKYTLALPKDSTLDASVLERTAATARELGLSNDAAQTLVDRTHAEVSQVLTAEHTAFEAKVAAWRTETLANPTFGKTPEERTAAIDMGRQVIDVHYAKVNPDGATTIKAFLNETGFGNHPAVVSFMHWLGKSAAEGPLLLGAPAGAKPKTAAEAMYPDQAGVSGAAYAATVPPKT